MKKTTLKQTIPAATLGLAAVLTVGLATSAKAGNASIPGLGGPTSLSVGAYWPSSDDAKRGGSTQINGELKYHIPVKDNPIETPSRTILGVGVQAGSKDGKHNTIIPITVGEEFGLNKKSPLATGNGYVGAGAGAYIINQSGISTATRLGGYVSAGYNFSQAVFGEAKYQWVDHGNGPMVNLGYRF